MLKKIKSALISVYYKDGLEPLARTLIANEVTIYSTGGTQLYLEALGIPCTAVETVTQYPSILGGRVKTLHPLIFGGILARRSNTQDQDEVTAYHIPEIDLVIVDLYPFEETLKSTTDTQLIIDKIDVGGPTMIRAAAKNYDAVVSIANKDSYATLNTQLIAQAGCTTLEQRRAYAATAFETVMHYDVAIHNYFMPQHAYAVLNHSHKQILRYGENPHQQGIYYGDTTALYTQLHGKELSYNNLVDVDAAIQLYTDVSTEVDKEKNFFSIIKHTNVCGIAVRNSVEEAFANALAGDPESAFGGVLCTNGTVDVATANHINALFFEVLIAPAFDQEALALLQSKKNRILLQLKPITLPNTQYKSLLNGTLVQAVDAGNYTTLEQVGGRLATTDELANLSFANIVCKHLKSNAIAIVHQMMLVGKGCGQTSRIDALKHAIAKANQYNLPLKGAVLASDAFFPFSDCVALSHKAGITAFIQPGGSIRDKDSIDYSVTHNLAMVLTQLRHFKH